MHNNVELFNLSCSLIVHNALVQKHFSSKAAGTGGLETPIQAMLYIHSHACLHSQRIVSRSMTHAATRHVELTDAVSHTCTLQYCCVDCVLRKLNRSCFHLPARFVDRPPVHLSAVSVQSFTVDESCQDLQVTGKLQEKACMLMHRRHHVSSPTGHPQCCRTGWKARCSIHCQSCPNLLVCSQSC